MRTAASTTQAIFDIGKGTVAFVAAAVAKTGDMKITTPTATLGIRGTTGVVDVPAGAAANNANNVNIKLYPDADGRVGHIDVDDRTSGTRLGALTQGLERFCDPAGRSRGRRHALCRGADHDSPHSRSRATAASSARCIWRRPRAGRSSPSSATSAAPIRPRARAFHDRSSRRNSNNCGRTRRPDNSRSGRTASPVRTTVQASSSRARQAAKAASKAPSRRSGRDKAAPCSRVRRARGSRSGQQQQGQAAARCGTAGRCAAHRTRYATRRHAADAATAERTDPGAARRSRAAAAGHGAAAANAAHRIAAGPAARGSAARRHAAPGRIPAAPRPPRNAPQRRADRRPLRRRRKSGGDSAAPHPEELAKQASRRARPRRAAWFETRAMRAPHHEGRRRGAALSSVIASAAKQSRIFPRRDSGLLRCARNDDLEGAEAPTNTPARGCFQIRRSGTA